MPQIARARPFFAFGVGPEIELPSILGAVVLPLPGFSSLPAVPLDGLGAGQLAISIPTAPAFAGATVTFQGLAITPLGASSVSAPGFLSLVP